MKTFNHITWFENTIKNIEKMTITSDYPKNILIAELSTFLDFWKKHDGNTIDIITNPETLCLERYDYLTDTIGIEISQLCNILSRAKKIESLPSISPKNMRIISCDINSKKSQELHTILSLASSVQYSEEASYTLDNSTLALLKTKYKDIYVMGLSEQARNDYMQLFTSSSFQQSVPTLNISLMLTDIDHGRLTYSSENTHSYGSYLPHSSTISLKTPNSYVFIHESFHSVDDALQKNYREHGSSDERIAFFHELYALLSGCTDNNVVNPFDYITYDKNHRLEYKEFTVYKYFSEQLNGITNQNIKSKMSPHWFQSWISYDVSTKGRYFSQPTELLARLYTTAYSIAYPELDDGVQHVDNMELGDWINRLTLSAERGHLIHNQELQEKLKDWMMRFNDYATSVLCGKSRQYPSRIIPQLSSDFNQNALNIITDIQKSCLKNMPALEKDTLWSSIFCVVHYKNAKINDYFREHIIQNLDTYYKTNGLSMEQKSYNIMQALVDYKNGHITASDIMKKIGFTSISINEDIADQLCDKYDAVLKTYQSLNNPREYYQPPLYI